MQTTAAFHWPRMQQMRVLEKKEKSNSSTFAPAFFFFFLRYSSIAITSYVATLYTKAN